MALRAFWSNDCKIISDSVLGLRSDKLVFSTDGGYTWRQIYSKGINDFSYVDGRIYILNGAISPTSNNLYSSVTVNKTKDFGDWWISLTSKNLPYPPKLPYSIYGIFFYKEGKGLLIGTSLTYTKDDFKTYERIDFLSDDDVYYNCEFLKNGCGIMTCARDWHYFYNCLVLSKYFGKHRGTYKLEDNTNWSIKYQENFHIGACEKDTTFFVVTEQLYGQKSCLSRITPADFDSLNLQPLGVHNPTTNATVTISPNLTSSVFSISCDKPLKNIAVFDLQGIEIYSKKCYNEENVTVDAAAWASGTYIVRVQTKDWFG